MKRKKPSEREKKRRFVQAAKTAGATYKRTEFRCPICKGVASVQMSCGQLQAECHCCGISAGEMV